MEDHCPDPSVRKTLEVDVSLIDHYDTLLDEVELYITRRAKAHDVQTLPVYNRSLVSGKSWHLSFCMRVRTSPGFPCVQDFVSYWRLVKGAKESKGKRLGTSGKKIGTGPLRWAFAEAAVLFLRHNQPGKAYFTKLEHKQGKAKALTVLAHKLGRAVCTPCSRGNTPLLSSSLSPRNC